MVRGKLLSSPLLTGAYEMNHKIFEVNESNADENFTVNSSGKK